MSNEEIKILSLLLLKILLNNGFNLSVEVKAIIKHLNELIKQL